MVHICTFPAGSCKSCHLYRKDEDYGRMACFYTADHSTPPMTAEAGNTMVTILRMNGKKETAPFLSIQAGDTFFVDGHLLVAVLKAFTPKDKDNHGNPIGYMVLDQSLNAWYPNDLQRD